MKMKLVDAIGNDWLVKEIYCKTKEGFMPEEAIALASAIREEIGRRRPKDGIENEIDGGTGAVHNNALAMYDKALGISE